MRLLVKQAVAPLAGQLAVPCSKYHAHRALILASLAPGTSHIDGMSDAAHVRHTIAALRRLGTRIEVSGGPPASEGVANGGTPGSAGVAAGGGGGCRFVVTGGAYRPQRGQVSVGSSGSTLYFLTGLMSLAEAPVTITGQKYFQRRPIGPLLDALAGLGVVLDAPSGCPPISVTPRRPTGGHVHIAGTLSQWISGLLLLAPFATGPSVIDVDGPFNERSYVELTIAMMREFGLHVRVAGGGRRFEIEPDQRPHPARLRLPPDIGSAAFGLAAAALHPSDVTLRGLHATTAADTDHPEAEVLDVLGAMGLPMRYEAASGLVRIQHDGLDLAPVEVDCRRMPDALPVLSVLSALAGGTSTFGNIAHVRLKESDRVSAMLQLNRMGARLEVHGDRLVCHGVRGLSGADLSSFNDHRVLMSLAVAGSRAEGETRLTYPHAYRISFPRFLDEMNAIGVPMSTTAPPPRAARRVAPAHTAPAPGRVARTPIAGLLRRWARERPDEPAVIDAGLDGAGERVLGWRELDERVDAAAALLLGLGVAPGEAVAYQLPNCAEFTVLAMAIARIGAVSCPIMPIFRRREQELLLRRSRARVLVVPEHFRGRDYAREIAGLIDASGAEPLALAHVLVVGGSVVGGGSAPSRAGAAVRWQLLDTALAAQRPDRAALDARAPAPDAPAQLLFTSGTSGEPKGVVHRMDALTRAAAMEVRHLGLDRTDRIFIPSPLAHQTGFLYGMWLAVVLGTAQVLQPVWDGPTALRLVRRWNATFVQAATPFLADLVQAVEEQGATPDSLRIFVATGTAVPRGLAERATRALGAAVCGAWGTTESCLGSLSAPGDEPALVWGTDGRALAGVRIRVTDDAGRRLAAGQEGNFEVKSACLFAGYLDHPEWTAQAMTPDGWYRSGDLAVIDEAGYVRISGRVKDVINRGGEKLPVAEIEQLLHTHPAVREVAVVAMPDERLGERACAFAVAAPGFDFAAMTGFLDARQLTKTYWPERLEVVDELPRNPSGKIQKFLLRERIRTMIEKERA